LERESWRRKTNKQIDINNKQKAIFKSEVYMKCIQKWRCIPQLQLKMGRGMSFM
jgi:hypothetical protein